MGQAGYDWVAVDLEHGSIAVHQLPDLCRALELGGTLPLARLAQGHPKDCKQALDAGAGGIIAPMVESADQLATIRDACRWPPAGSRGVGFSRANLFGRHFDDYAREAQAPLLVAMIEHYRAVDALSEILNVEGLDAILIGPYDLSASIGRTAEFTNPEFESLMARIEERRRPQRGRLRAARRSRPLRRSYDAARAKDFASWPIRSIRFSSITEHCARSYEDTRPDSGADGQQPLSGPAHGAITRRPDDRARVPPCGAQPHADRRRRGHLR